MTLTSLDELKSHLNLTEKELHWEEKAENTLPLLISQNILSLIDNPSIRRQFVPSKDENIDTIGNLDPLKEEDNSISSRLIHRYSNRAAFLTTDRCFAYCRHCFRRRFTGTMTGPASEAEIAEAAAYLKEHKEIKEVLLTGGDLMTLSDEKLDYLLHSFKSAREDIIYRLCTRALVSSPERFTPEFFKMLEKHNHHAPFFLMTQFNHAIEITEKAIDALIGFVKLGIPMMNQCVLLRGVNDTLDQQIELCNKLMYNRIKPYYLFQGDLVKGTAHLRVPLSKGLALEKEMRKHLSGLSMPQYTIDLPSGGGKVILTENYLVSRDRNLWTFKTPDGEERSYPEDF